MLPIIPQLQIVREKSELFRKDEIRESVLSMPYEDGRVQRLLRKVWGGAAFRKSCADEMCLSVNGYTEGMPEDTFRVLSRHDGSYYISIDENGIYVFSLCAAGLFYGIQTLRQIFESNAEVQCCEIIDYPDIEMRCAYLDLRQSFPRFENLIPYIEMMAEFKTNTLIIEYEDTFPFEKYSHLKNRKHAFTDEQLLLILEAARQNFIEVIPLQQSFGHLEYVLKDRRHMHLRETAADLGELCPCNPDSLKLVCGLIDEVAAKHPGSRYIHLGCDEVWSLGSCGRCKERYGENKGRMFVDFVNKLVSHVCDSGKKPIIWHDMLEQCGEHEIAKLDNRVSVMVWLYGAAGLKKQISGLTELFRKYGIEVFGACSVRSNDGLDTQDYPIIEARLQNIDGWAAEAKRLDIPFVAATNWAAAFSMGAPYGIYETSIYPMYYCGERLWNHKSRRNTFLRRFLKIFHGIGYADEEWDKGIAGYGPEAPCIEDYYGLLGRIAGQAQKHKDIADFICILSEFHILAREFHCANSYLYRYRMFQGGEGELISLRNRTKAKVERFLAFKPVLREALERFLPEEMAEMYIAARYFVPEKIYTEVYKKYKIL